MIFINRWNCSFHNGCLWKFIASPWSYLHQKAYCHCTDLNTFLLTLSHIRSVSTFHNSESLNLLLCIYAADRFNCLFHFYNFSFDQAHTWFYAPCCRWCTMLPEKVIPRRIAFNNTGTALGSDSTRYQVTMFCVEFFRFIWSALRMWSNMFSMFCCFCRVWSCGVCRLSYMVLWSPLSIPPTYMNAN